MLELFLPWRLRSKAINSALAGVLMPLFSQTFEHFLIRLARIAAYDALHGSVGLAFLKFKAKLGSSLQQMLRLLQLNFFERRNLIGLFQAI